MFAKTLLTLLAAAANAYAAALPNEWDLLERANVGDKLVFCHFMIGIVADRTGPGDYDADMQRAKSLGIDAFALNIGTDPYTDQQLGYAYQSAANNGMQVFISFDFNWWSPSSGASAVGSKIAQYASLPAQLKVGGATFASSFAGDGLDVATVRNTAGSPIFFAPNFHPGQGNFGIIDGALNWMAWPNNGNNKAPQPGANVTVLQGDQTYIPALGGKPLIAPASAWFSTHYGPEVSYSKNWVFPSDLLWYQRWNDILVEKPQYIEIITWNDYGESHYIGPLSSKHNDDGNSKWTNDMPHNGWLDIAKPYIAAWKAGASAPTITSDEIVYWYRPTPASLNCDSTDTTMVSANNASGNYFEGRPNGWQTMQDSVFVVSLLTAPGTVVVNAAGTVYEYNAPAGASSFQVPMHVGTQAFSLVRNGATVISATSLRPIANTCPCGIYNFNAFVGTVPAGPLDVLGPDGLNQLTVGLHVACAAVPTYTTTPATVAPTATSVIGSGPTVTIGTTTAPKPTSTSTTAPKPSSTSTTPAKPTTSTTTTKPAPPPPTTTYSGSVPTGTAGTSIPCSQIPTWSATTSYDGNSIIQYKGIAYYALWVNYDEEPDVGNNIYYVWQPTGETC